MASSYTGMSNNQKVEPLLRTIGGRLAPPKKPEPADDAPPVSDDSDVDFGSLSTSTYADIQRSVFMPKSPGHSTASRPTPQKTAGQKKKKNAGIHTRPVRGRVPKADNGLGELELLDPESPERASKKQEEDARSEEWDAHSTGSKRKAYDGDERLGSHHASALGRRRPVKTKAEYDRGSGFKKDNSSDEEKPARKVKRNKKQAQPTDSPPSSPRPGLRLPSDIPGNEGRSSPRQGLNDVFDKSLFSDDPTPKRKGLRGVFSKDLFSDDPTPKRKGLKGVLDKALFADDKTPKRKGLKNFGGLQDTQTQVSPPRKGLNLPSGPPSDISDLDEENPEMFSQLPSRPRSASSSSLIELSARSPTTLISPSASRPVCPMCNEEVDRSLLDEFRKRHPTTSWREQQAFCTQHKRAKAVAVWKERKYPSIDWKTLDARVSRQSGFLRKILKGGKSHFRDAFAEKVKEAGRDRTVRRAEEYMVPGYYGGRGMRAMSDKIVDDLSSVLRESSVKDELVSAARGVGAYVQAVLVPELAVRLIMEDMDVGSAEARRIMEESMWLGELVNEELDDVVLGDDEEDEEEHDDSGLPGEDDRDSSSESSLSDLESD